MIPELTTEQRRENLEKAMAARSCRAEILKGVADGKCSVADVYPGMGMPSTIPRYCPYCGTRQDVHYCKEETPDVDK